MKRNTCLLSMTVVIGFSGVAWAKTVALWPLEYDGVTKTFDLRDRAGGYDLYDPKDGAYNTACAGTGWVLPPNPDGALRAEYMRNRMAVASDNTSNQSAVLKSDEAGLFLRGDKDYTLEGFFRLRKIMEANKDSAWYGVAASCEPSATRNFFGFYRSAQSDLTAEGEFKWVYKGAKKSGNTSIFSEPIPAAKVASMTNEWHHFAIVFVNESEQNKSVLTIYVDGEKQIEYERSVITADSVAAAGSDMEIGGRGSSKNRAPIELDYLRLSDVALAPSEFLSAGSAPAAMPCPTVAYWKLGATATAVDGRPSVGTRQVADWRGRDSAGGLDVILTAAPSCDQAPGFVDNVGSFCLDTDDAGLYSATLGAEMSLRSPFTLEGSFKPQFGGGVADEMTLAMVAKSASLVNWHLQLVKDDGAWKVRLSANDGSATPLVDRQFFGLSLPTDWNEWKRLAISYDPMAGNGTWSLSVDGQPVGTIVNAAEPSADETKYGSIFYLGGCKSSYGDGSVAFRGLLDEVCLYGATPSDLVAQWPLDVINGLYLDGRDTVGDNHFVTPNGLRGKQVYYAVPDADDEPVIENPDRSPDFVGDPSELSGCADLSGGYYRYLASFDPAMMAALNADADFTIEGYFKRAAAGNSTSEHLLTFYSSMTTNDVTTRLIFAYCGDDGFRIKDSMKWATSSATQYYNSSDDKADIPVGEWVHCAFTRKFQGNGKVAWEVFTNGVSIGVKELDAVAGVAADGAYFGGRPTSKNGFNGKISSIRVSNRVLAPSEFLCATVPAPIPGGTLLTVDSLQGGTNVAHAGILTAPAASVTIEGRIPWTAADAVIAGTYDVTTGRGWKLYRENGALKVFGSAGLFATPYLRAIVRADCRDWVGKDVDLAVSVSKGGVWTFYANTIKFAEVEDAHPAEPLEVVPYPVPLVLGSEALGLSRKWRVTERVLSAGELQTHNGLILIFR